MKKLILLVFLSAFFLLGKGQSLEYNQYWIQKYTDKFKRYIPENSIIYLADSNKFYRIINTTYTPLKTMRNVFTDGNYIRISSGGYFIYPGMYNKELALDDTIINVGFKINETSMVYINGNLLSTVQWNGEGTTILRLNLDIRLFDNLTIKR